MSEISISKLTITDGAPDSPSITMEAKGGNAVFCVTNRHGSIDIIAESNKAPYFIMWNKGHKYPPLALSMDESGKLVVQVVEPKDGESWIESAKFISASELMELNTDARTN